MKLQFLGTGTSQGIPVIGSDDPVCLSADFRDKRLRSSIFVSTKNKAIVIDTGPDFRQQMLAHHIYKVDAVLYTHEHSDHTAGIDDIRPFCSRFGSMPIYAQERVISNLRERFAYIFATENRYEGAPSVVPQIIDKENFNIGECIITPIKIGHGNIDILGFRIGDLVYITDAKTVDDKERIKIKGAKVLIVNALRIAKHPTHFNLQDALDFIEEMNPETAYITHISHKLGFQQEVQKSLPKNVYLAYDGLEIKI